MLQDLTDIVILPTYATLVSETAALARAAVALRDTPNAETLAATQAAWRAARRPWKQGEAFRFGPTENLQLRIRTKLDWWPPNEDRIEEEIDGVATLTPEYIDSQGVNKRGFAALEYLLFDDGDDATAVLAALNGSNGARRREYVVAVAEDMALQSHKLLDAWLPGAGDFRAELLTAGQGSATYDSLKKAIDEVVGAMVLLAATIEEKQLAQPAGIVPVGAPRPDLLAFTRSGSTLTDTADNVASLSSVYRCAYGDASGMSMAALVQRSSPEIDAAVIAALDRTARAVALIPEPVTTALAAHPDRLRVAHGRAHELRLSLSVDLASALGATPRFVGDGD
jgi:predicted lipoprotein